ncbi:MAG: class I SAM-dependent methyltransferase [Opitutales bacterium]|nr:class I SAM-dependent methyltransferase [Opitutales bacterium]
MKLSRCSEVHDQINHEICGFLKRSKNLDKKAKLLDVGCWNGITTHSYVESLGINEGYGIEYYEDKTFEAKHKGIIATQLNIETDEFPYEDDCFDYVVCNQVFEHLKLIYKPFDEISRVLKPGGLLIFSVPNLASFHNRLMLLWGVQPSSIRVFGPHVRGFTLEEFKKFSVFGDKLTIEKVIGVGFYPFPTATLGKIMAKVWKNACHTPIVILKKNSCVDSEIVSHENYMASKFQTVFE